ncbi:MAG: ATP-binding protein [Sulfuriferula sp.]
MAEISEYNALIAAIEAIDTCQQTLSLTPAASGEISLLEQAICRLLGRLTTELKISDKASDSLAAASVRMVLLADIQARLNKADKLVKTTRDLKEFLERILVDLGEMTGARMALYATIDGKGNMSSLLAHGIDTTALSALRVSDSFRQFAASFIDGEVIVSKPKPVIASDLQLLNCPILVTPLRINGRSVGVILLLDRVGAEVFSRDDIFMLEHLLPDILRVLERIELLRALEQSNRSLHAEKSKQKMLIEQLESAQGQLLQSEKMASVGQLAAGVAHEINNPIGYVYSNLNSLEKYVQEVFSLVDIYAQAESQIMDEVLRSRIQAVKAQLDMDFLKEDLQALMRESKEGIVRVKKIVQDLKDFSHVDASEDWNFANIQAGMDSTLNIVNNEIKYKAEVIKEYGDIPDVECLISQLNQVFMNILVNAAHAIEERGVITVRMGQQNDNEVWIEIADTGQGIAPENIKRIFDPFFTTKPIGKGTGLGLSLSYGIVQKHHGRIEVRSELGKGSVFKIYLPVRRPGAEQSDEVKNNDQISVNGAEGDVNICSATG